MYKNMPNDIKARVKSRHQDNLNGKKYSDRQELKFILSIEPQRIFT